MSLPPPIKLLRVYEKRVAKIQTPDDGKSVESRLIRCYADVLGKFPSDYVIREASDVASQLNEDQWERLPSLLRDPSFKQRVDSISLEAFGLRANISERFTTGVRAIAYTEDAALSHLQGIVDEEVRELDQVWRREILSEMPNSLAGFVEKIERDSESIINYADALSATKHCGVCGEVLVDPDALEESLADYYELDEAPGVPGGRHTQSPAETTLRPSTPLHVSWRAVSEGLRAPPTQ